MTRKKQIEPVETAHNKPKHLYIVADRAGIPFEVANMVAGNPFAVIDDQHRGWEPAYIGFTTPHRAEQAQLWRTPDSIVIVSDQSRPVEIDIAERYAADHGAPDAIYLIGYSAERYAAVKQAFKKDIPNLEVAGFVLPLDKDSD